MTDQEIISRHPDFFDLSGDATKTQLMFGFQGVGPGWLAIIERLCTRLQAIAGPEVKFTSVKEKGTLRISYRGGNDEVEAAVESAKADALLTCEMCGAPETVKRQNGVWAVTCEKCANG
jgi:hypothetical protein